MSIVSLVFGCVYICACDKGEETDTITEINRDDYNAKVKELANVFEDVYLNAFDGENIDFIKYDSIVSSRLGISEQEFFQMQINAQRLNTRSEGSTAFNVAEYLTDSQLALYNEFTQLLEMKQELSDKDYQIMLNKCNSLPQEEQELMKGIFETTKAILDALNICKKNLSTRAENPTWAKYVCNLTVSGCGTIWSTMAAGVALAAGAATLTASGIGLVIGLAGGAALSTVAC